MLKSKKKSDTIPMKKEWYATVKLSVKWYRNSSFCKTGKILSTKTQNGQQNFRQYPSTGLFLFIFDDSSSYRRISGFSLAFLKHLLIFFWNHLDAVIRKLGTPALQGSLRTSCALYALSATGDWAAPKLNIWNKTLIGLKKTYTSCSSSQ